MSVEQRLEGVRLALQILVLVRSGEISESQARELIDALGMGFSLNHEAAK